MVNTLINKKTQLHQEIQNEIDIVYKKMPVCHLPMYNPAKLLRYVINVSLLGSVTNAPRLLHFF